MKETTEPATKLQYRDRWVRLAATVIATHIIIVYGEPESSFELLLTRDYYSAFAGSFPIALLLIEYVHRITSFLDRRYEWVAKSVPRILAQLLLALAVPGIGAFFLAFVYFRVRGIDILATTYLRYDFHFILLMLVLANAYYLCYYFYLKWQITEQLVTDRSEVASPILPTVDEQAAQEEEQPAVFIISTGSATIPIRTDSIACFFRDSETNYLRTFEGEDIFIPRTLDDIEAQLDGQRFFRANRQMIVSFPAVSRYKVIEYGKVEVSLDPYYKDPVVVSQKRARGFRQWFDFQQYRSSNPKSVGQHID